MAIITKSQEVNPVEGAIVTDEFRAENDAFNQSLEDGTYVPEAWDAGMEDAPFDSTARDAEIASQDAAELLKTQQPAVVDSSVARETTDTNLDERTKIETQLSEAQTLLAQKQAALAALLESQTTTITEAEAAAGDIEDPEEREKTFAEIELEKMYNELDAVVEADKLKLDELTLRMSATARSIADGIKAQFDQRRLEQRDANRRRMGSQVKLGFRSGRQRFASEIQTSILSAEEAAGIQRLAVLDMQEQQMLLQAEQAENDRDFQLFNTRMTMATSARQEKIQVLNDLARLSTEQERLAREKTEFDLNIKLKQQELAANDPDVSFQKDVAITTLLGALEDPTSASPLDLFNTLNFDPFTGAQTGNISLEQINDVIDRSFRAQDNPETYSITGTPTTGIWEVQKDPLTGQVLSTERLIAPQASAATLMASANTRALDSTTKAAMAFELEAVFGTGSPQINRTVLALGGDTRKLPAFLDAFEIRMDRLYPVLDEENFPSLDEINNMIDSIAIELNKDDVSELQQSMTDALAPLVAELRITKTE